MLGNKNIIDKLDLLETALECDAVEWQWNEKEQKLYAFYPEGNSEYPLVTAFWISEEDGERWVWAYDYWPDGDIMTGVAKVCQARVA